MQRFYNQDLENAHNTIMNWVRQNVDFYSVRSLFYMDYLKAIDFLAEYESDLRRNQEEDNETGN